jgi:hypothetical protein
LNTSPGKAHHAADTMSRLLSSSPDCQAPATVDTDIPCFPVNPDPTLLSAEDLVAHQHSDPTLRHISRSIGSDPSLEYDDFGAVGRVVPSGEFQVSLPPTLAANTPVTLVQPISYPTPERDARVRGDAHHLRREVVQGITSLQAKFSASPSAVTAVVDTLPHALQTEEIIRKQATDHDCQEFAALAGADSLFDHDASGALVLRAPLDGSRQIVVPASLQPRVLHLEHFPRTAGHPGVTRMFRTLRLNTSGE